MPDLTPVCNQLNQQNDESHRNTAAYCPCHVNVRHVCTDFNSLLLAAHHASMYVHVALNAHVYVLCTALYPLPLSTHHMLNLLFPGGSTARWLEWPFSN